MRIYYKLYKHCDSDLYSIHLAGISVSSLMRLALVYRAAGKRLHIFIPQCLPCDVDGLGYMMRLRFNLTEPESIRFLRDEIKPRHRTRYLKLLLRQSLVVLPSGVCLKHGSQIEEENRMNNEEFIGGLNDLLILTPGTFKKKYIHQVVRCTLPDELVKALEREDQNDDSGGFDYVDDESGIIISHEADGNENEEDDDDPFPGL